MEDVDVNFELVWWIALLWISIWPCFTDWIFFFLSLVQLKEVMELPGLMVLEEP